MKLKQRLILAPLLLFLFLVTRNLWSDGSDEEPWKDREKRVGPVYPRNPNGSERYPGAFQNVGARDSAARPYPPNQNVPPNQNHQPAVRAPPPPQPRQPVVQAPPRNELPPEPPKQQPISLPPKPPQVPVAQNLPPQFHPPKPEAPKPNPPQPKPPQIDPPKIKQSPKEPPKFSVNSAPKDDHRLLAKPTTRKTTTKTTTKSRIPPGKLPGGNQLPLPTMKPAARKNFVDEEMKRIAINLETKSQNDPWNTAKDWLKPRSVYPNKHQALGSILHTLSTTKVMKADILTKGTQLKMLLYLQGNQKVIFKPKRYEREHIIQGKAYDGYDRHNGEIAAFQFDRILNFRRAPIVVGRRINLDSEIIPVATERLKSTFKKKNGNTCFYGQCYYCKENELACGKGEIMEGSVTLWMADTFSLEKIRHPYQRTYRDDKQARWEMDNDYCNNYVKRTFPYDKGVRLLDLMDTAIFDFIIGNADRHHYEVFADQPDSMVLLLDNAKSFGNPHHDELSILAPISQCCLLRKSTFERLVELKGGLLTKMMIEATKTDPIAPILHKKHIEAINRRMPIIFSTLTKCVQENGKDAVIVDTWKGVPTDNS